MSRVVAKREIGWLASVISRSDIKQRCNAHLIVFRLAHARPLADTFVQLISWNIFSSHHTRTAPIALQRISISKVLTQLGGILTGTQSIAEDFNAAICIAGKCQSETQICTVNVVLVFTKSHNCSFVIAHGRLRQCVTQNSARVRVTQIQRVAKTCGSRLETTAFKIGCAQHRTIACIARFCLNGSFCMGDSLCSFAFSQRALRFAVRAICARRVAASSAASQRNACERSCNGQCYFRSNDVCSFCGAGH